MSKAFTPILNHLQQHSCPLRQCRHLHVLRNLVGGNGNVVSNLSGDSSHRTTQHHLNRTYRDTAQGLLRFAVAPHPEQQLSHRSGRCFREQSAVMGACTEQWSEWINTNQGVLSSTWADRRINMCMAELECVLRRTFFIFSLQKHLCLRIFLPIVSRVRVGHSDNNGG